MHLPQRRRLHRSRILFFLSGVLLCFVYTLTFKARLPEPWRALQTAGDSGIEGGGIDDDGGVLRIDAREIAAANETSAEEEAAERTPEGTQGPLVMAANRTDLKHCIYVDLEPPKPTPTPPKPPPAGQTAAPAPAPPPHRKGEYPEDLFSVTQRQQGWVTLHILGMIYMFVSLAIVCDEFFVPALGVITDKLDISDDVAGATFMAAGGSAPELFTSLIGVFISHSNVGIGTIVGSAVFNILFVIGMCAIFSREMLYLTWWPLFRDVSFYTVDLVMLIVFFLDNTIQWWESVMLVCGYVAYVSFMKFNVWIERAVKTQLHRHMGIVKVMDETEKDSETPAALPPPDPKDNSLKHNKPPEKSLSKDSDSTAALPPQEPKQHTLKTAGHTDKSLLKVKPVLQRGGSVASLHNPNLRNTIFQLMIHTLDPLGEDTVFRGDMRGPGQMRARRENAFNGDVRLERTVQGKVRNKVNPAVRGKLDRRLQRKAEDEEDQINPDQAGSVSVQVTSPAEPSTSHALRTGQEKKNEAQDKPAQERHTEAGGVAAGSGGREKDERDDDHDDCEEEEEEEEEEKEIEEIEEPLSLRWPETRRKQLTYLFLLPIVFPLWLTVPDVRNPASKKYFVGTFIGSILWIAIFSYLMVWWAHQVGETIGISEEIMGLTILAAGTSIPDLITSVIVARKGLGDMAVSSSVGSNIFDITIGLPVPWLLYSLAHGGVAMKVSSNGLFCAIVLLFLMLLFVIASIAACRWRMSRALGLAMFLLYFLFLVLSVMLEDRVIVCPISI